MTIGVKPTIRMTRPITSARWTLPRSRDRETSRPKADLTIPPQGLLKTKRKVSDATGFAHKVANHPSVARSGAEHIKNFREASISCEAGWWNRIAKNFSSMTHHPVCSLRSQPPLLARRGDLRLAKNDLIAAGSPRRPAFPASAVAACSPA